jgi:hypothetical protein
MIESTREEREDYLGTVSVTIGDHARGKITSSGPQPPWGQGRREIHSLCGVAYRRGRMTHASLPN